MSRTYEEDGVNEPPQSGPPRRQPHQTSYESRWAIRPKVGAGGITGSLAIFLVWLSQQAGVMMPAEVAVAFATILMVIAAYLMPER
jgi:hypothetical protein